MKKTFFIFILFLLESSLVSAQDTILFNNGDETLVKVTEVNDTEIKYQLWVNPNGPTYTHKVSDIFMIKYMGGHREVYNSRQENPETTNSSESAQATNQKNKKRKDNGINLIADISYLPMKGFEISPVVLYRFNQLVSLGAGFSLGGGEVNFYGGGESIGTAIGTTSDGIITITPSNTLGFSYRLFSRVMVFFSDTKVAPFMSIDFAMFFNGRVAINLLPKIGISTKISNNNFLELSVGTNFNFYFDSFQITNDKGDDIDTGIHTYSIYKLNTAVTISYRHLFRFKK